MEFRTQKALSDTRAVRMIFEQIQNLFTLYRSKPRFGPESCEDSINFMNHLRPVKNYFESIDESIVKALENFGPEVNRNRQSSDFSTEESLMNIDNNNNNKLTRFGDEDVEQAENDLDKYSSKLLSYLNEKPIDCDNELVYSKGSKNLTQFDTNVFKIKLV